MPGVSPSGLFASVLSADDFNSCMGALQCTGVWCIFRRTLVLGLGYRSRWWCYLVRAVVPTRHVWRRLTPSQRAPGRGISLLTTCVQGFYCTLLPVVLKPVVFSGNPAASKPRYVPYVPRHFSDFLRFWDGILPQRSNGTI